MPREGEHLPRPQPRAAAPNSTSSPATSTRAGWVDSAQQRPGGVATPEGVAGPRGGRAATNPLLARRLLSPGPSVTAGCPLRRFRPGPPVVTCRPHGGFGPGSCCDVWPWGRACGSGPVCPRGGVELPQGSRFDKALGAAAAAEKSRHALRRAQKIAGRVRCRTALVVVLWCRTIHLGLVDYRVVDRGAVRKLSRVGRAGHSSLLSPDLPFLPTLAEPFLDSGHVDLLGSSGANATPPRGMRQGPAQRAAAQRMPGRRRAFASAAVTHSRSSY